MPLTTPPQWGYLRISTKRKVVAQIESAQSVDGAKKLLKNGAEDKLGLGFRGKGQAGFSGASRKETCGLWGPWGFDDDERGGVRVIRRGM